MKMDKVNHLLSFVANSDANMLTIHLDKDGIEFLIERLSGNDWNELSDHNPVIAQFQ